MFCSRRRSRSAARSMVVATSVVSDPLRQTVAYEPQFVYPKVVLILTALAAGVAGRGRRCVRWSWTRARCDRFDLSRCSPCRTGRRRLPATTCSGASRSPAEKSTARKSSATDGTWPERSGADEVGKAIAADSVRRLSRPRGDAGRSRPAAHSIVAITRAGRAPSGLLFQTQPRV
jgi:hypothetical protein